MTVRTDTSALEVARVILGQIRGEHETIDDATLAAAAICLSNANGAFRVGNTTKVVLVLCDISTCDNDLCPHIVSATLPTEWQDSAGYPVPRLARLFRSKVIVHIGDEIYFPPRFHDTWMAVLAEAEEAIPFGGPTGIAPVAVTDSQKNGEMVHWHNLGDIESFPIGCVIWAVRRDGTLVAYQRLLSNLFVTVARLQNPMPAANPTAVLARLQTTSFEPVQGKPPVVYAT
jgi:hypothetical protein